MLYLSINIRSKKLSYLFSYTFQSILICPIFLISGPLLSITFHGRRKIFKGAQPPSRQGSPKSPTHRKSNLGSGTRALASPGPFVPRTDSKAHSGFVPPFRPVFRR